jgi:hypothetical protein
VTFARCWDYRNFSGNYDILCVWICLYELQLLLFHRFLCTFLDVSFYYSIDLKPFHEWTVFYSNSTAFSLWMIICFCVSPSQSYASPDQYSSIWLSTKKYSAFNIGPSKSFFRQSISYRFHTNYRTQIDYQTWFSGNRELAFPFFKFHLLCVKKDVWGLLFGYFFGFTYSCQHPCCCLSNNAVHNVHVASLLLTLLWPMLLMPLTVLGVSAVSYSLLLLASLLLRQLLLRPESYLPGLLRCGTSPTAVDSLESLL